MEIEISVIIPFYNSGETLRECIEGVMAQDHPGFEVVLIDDASTENCSRHIPDDPRVRVIRNKTNLGPGGSRNAGFKEAKGKLIVLIDSDAAVDDPGWLSKHAAAHEGQTGMIVGGGIEGCGKGLVSMADKFCHWHTNIPNAEPFTVRKDTRRPLAQVSRHLVTNNMSFLRATQRELGDFDPDFRTGEDVDFCMRALDMGMSLRLEPSILVRHYDRENLKDYFRCFYMVGKDRIPLRRKHKSGLEWLLPKNALSTVLYAPALSFVLPLTIIMSWWKYDKTVVLSYPLLVVACFAMTCGIFAFFREEEAGC